MPVQALTPHDIAMRTLLFTFILALLSALTSAQTFSNVAIAEASTVCSIAQDEQGMVWLGTERGLYSYDGYRTIQHNTSADCTPMASRLRSIQEDKQWTDLYIY